eukprot:Sspe_Gene.68738::Locus_40526_Transcript_2_2_Confidence_0.667_Length_1275::g.68738::m.68738/K14803/PTC2_3; protein phosphatase PTC2/3
MDVYMTGTLPHPRKDKMSEGYENGCLIVGATAMQGWRKGMEDAHSIVLHLNDKDVGPWVAFFGVYDGHCGSKIARYAGDQMHQSIMQTPDFKEKRWKEALRNGYLALDEEVLNHPDLREDKSGCTAVTCLVTEGLDLVCGNAGDSRCVLSRGGQAVPLSFDHKPTNDAEAARIAEAGSFIANGRVNGNLALSRAIGDFEFKDNHDLPPTAQAISAEPEVVATRLLPEDEFLVLACDGIWDVMSNEAVVAFISERLQKAGQLDCLKLTAICEELCDECLGPKPCGKGSDNMTVILVVFKKGDWRCFRRASTGEACATQPCSCRAPDVPPVPAPTSHDPNDSSGYNGNLFDCTINSNSSSLADSYRQTE